MNEKKTIEVSISTLSILKVLGIILGVLLLYQLRDIILILFLVLILTAALSPVVKKLQEKRKMPKILAILSIYLAIIIGFIFVGYLIIPPVVSQFQALVKDLPSFLEKITPLFHSLGITPSISDFETLSKTLGTVTTQIISTTAGAVSAIAVLIIVLVLTLFLLLEEDGIKRFFISILPIKERDYIVELTKKIGEKVGAWMIGELYLMGLVGLLTFIGLLILRIPYALTLALIAAFLEVIPNVGPVLAAIPAIFIALITKSYLWAAIVLLFYVAVQQVENQIFVPKVMQKMIGLSPVITIVAILIGFKLAGILGALLAVPIVAALSVLVQEWPKIKEKYQSLGSIK